MAKENGNRGPANPVTEAWSKHWHVPVILLMLREWNSYGYELMERMASFGFGMMNPGTFYRTLRQMEKDGIVSSSWDTSDTGPARRIYSITEAGEAYLKLWADSLDQYQRMMNSFFNLYTARPTVRANEKEDE
ncbi:MAG: poly-beta-hydroxybutyrate-responsive repressor [Ktedonobacteraceae bacterium]|nr:poly-beta-hydroxybutyrate-responsive repressor [Ktedonobacteraceae bacterium]